MSTNLFLRIISGVPGSALVVFVLVMLIHACREPSFERVPAPIFIVPDASVEAIEPYCPITPAEAIKRSQALSRLNVQSEEK